MTTEPIQLCALKGRALGHRSVSYNENDAILYALSVGAPPDSLELVYERDLEVLPTLALALGLWSVEAAGALGAYEPQRSLHVGQHLEVLAPLPRAGDIEMQGSVRSVWDKGKAAVLEIETTSSFFSCLYTILIPGSGGWGGERGPSAEVVALEPRRRSTFRSSPSQAVLYRLTGDRHPIHVDPAVAEALGFDRPILHGLCTLGIGVREAARQAGVSPHRLRSLDARFTAVVFPGDELEIASAPEDAAIAFRVSVGETIVVTGGRATFDGSGPR